MSACGSIAIADGARTETALTELTVADVLAMPVLRAAKPSVVAGRAGLSRRVHWVHSTELSDIAPLLRGGDLLLSTGIAMPENAGDLAAFAESLADSGAAGLIVELGRRWTALPVALRQACDKLDLPLVALSREVRFAAVAQAVGERIIDHQLGELRESQRVHDTFTELSVAEAGPDKILEAVQRLAGTTVVLETEEHRIVDYRSGPGDIEEFLSNWQARSRAVKTDGRTTWDPDNGWLISRLGRRDRRWGRLIVESPQAPSQRLSTVAERAAAALALHRLHDRHRDSAVRRTHHELILGLLQDPTDAEVLRRCELAGVPMHKRQFVGLTLRPHGGGSAGASRTVLDGIVAATVHAVAELRVRALVCEVDHDVRVLLSLAPSSNPERIVGQLAERLGQRHTLLVCAGRAVSRLADIDRTLREAQHVAASVREPTPGVLVHRLEDVHLRGLLTLLADDDRLRLFVRRELGALREHDEQTGSRLLEALRALVEHPGSKSDAAARLHLSRPVFYDRLRRIERLLGVNLEDPDVRVSLHVALLAEEVLNAAR